MSPQTIVNVLLVLAVLVLVGYRQSTWRPIQPERIWRAPILFGVVGLAFLAPSAATMTTADLAAVVIELAVSLGAGAWMGAIARIRPVAEAAPAGSTSRRGGAAYESRTGWWGMALWVLVLAARIGIDIVASGLGAHALMSTGMILLLVAANRTSRAAVLSARLRWLLARGAVVPVSGAHAA